MTVVNFSAGPAGLPRVVLERVRDELPDYRGRGVSILEQSHRGPDYDAVHRNAMRRLRTLLEVPESHDILFLQGGASGMFALVPLNFLRPGTSADYVMTGRWSDRALSEAATLGTARSAGTGKQGDRYVRIPSSDDLDLDDAAAYVHITSNNTVVGSQYHAYPQTRAPLVADMSSDILSGPLDVSRFHLIYAGAQKNLGPAGVTVVIARRDWMAEARTDIPKIFRFQTHAEAESLYNTPPTFAVYLLGYVMEWIEEQGGAAAMRARNEEKQRLVYSVIDDYPDFFDTDIERPSRSWMNVTYRLPNPELDRRFLAEAEAHGMIGLKGHRSVGGIRASLYNAVEVEGVRRLAELMRDFAQRGG